MTINVLGSVPPTKKSGKGGYSTVSGLRNTSALALIKEAYVSY